MTAPSVLNVDPVEENQRQSCPADENPKSEAMKERSDADFFERFFVEASADEKKSRGQPNFAEVAYRAKGGSKHRKGAVQKRSNAEQQDEPRPLNTSFAFLRDRGDKRQGNNPQGSSQLNGCGNREGCGTESCGGADN